MSASHTKSSSSSSQRILRGLGLVDLSSSQLPERLVGKVSEELELFASRMHEDLLAASVAVGLEVMSGLMEAEVIARGGPKGRPDAARDCYRHGSEDGGVTLQGRRVPVRRPSWADDRGEGELLRRSYGIPRYSGARR